ncbi:hypothetical protein LBMAG53_08760 [Planctomycetota bacterium]|nr:hypothetical protein LBMAG53_08760 [Planctomycetota bacterium]
MNTSRPPSDGTSMISRMRRHRLNGLAEMSAGMAHEINQPLGGIRGFAEGILIGLEEGWDISQAEIIAKMRRIVDEADRIDQLIQGVRSFADEDARLELMEVDVLPVVKAAMRMMGTRLQAHGVDLNLQTDGLPAVVQANPFALQEVVQILLSNAGDGCLDRTDGAHTGRVAVRIHGGLNRSDPVQVIIEDDGVGMDEATLARAGEPFFTTKGPDRGVGLGLATARGILAQCHGRLHLASGPGRGTVASVNLSQRAPHQDSP